MGGIGKTTLARNVFTDKLIEEHFDICLWATISQEHNIEQTLIEVLSQYQGREYSSGEKKSVAELGEELHKYLFGRRYLAVLDDMWSIEVWDKMRFYFPDCGQRSRVIVTTRMSNLAAHLSSSDNSLYMSFLNEVDSWTLFSKAVFGSEGSVVPELREIGEKIVGKCKGLPLSIAVIGGLLARSELTQGFWEYIEKNLNSIVNMENEEYCLRVLKLSYNHLPAYLKPCFLYMGVFDEDRKIKVSTIIDLWVSEGFVKPRKTKNLEAVAWEYFQELVDRNLLLPHKSKPSTIDWMEFRELGWVGKNIKWCKMHDLVRVGRLHLPLPPNNDDDDIVILENLHTLNRVENFHLNEDVVTRIPNLRILNVRYSRDDLNREVHSLSYLGHLSKLESFLCSTTAGSDADLQLICFPPSLKEIVLISRSPCPRVEWEDVLRKIGRLPLVEELMIGGGVFGSRNWETVEGQFPMLKRLELEICHGLEKWTVPEASHFPLLEKLILHDLYRLEEIPSAIGDIATLRSIELNECSESAVLSAKRIVEEQEDLYGEDELSFRVLVKTYDAAALRLASPNFQVE